MYTYDCIMMSWYLSLGSSPEAICVAAWAPLKRVTVGPALCAEAVAHVGI